MWGERLTAAAIGVAVFLAGAALLSLEIASSRVMAPYFGSSLFVWGALIGIVLAGLSVGYWVGGIVADRVLATPDRYTREAAFYGELETAVERVLLVAPGGRLAGPWVALYRL